jgi:hypothetical protein
VKRIIVEVPEGDPIIVGDSVLFGESGTTGVVVEVAGRPNDDAPQWCPICKRYHTGPIGEATDSGIPTRACPLVPTGSLRYYGSQVYAGHLPA